MLRRFPLGGNSVLQESCEPHIARDMQEAQEMGGQASQQAQQTGKGKEPAINPANLRSGSGYVPPLESVLETV